MNITIFGIGRLGAPMAALFAEAGHHCFCIDKSEATLEAIRQRRAPVKEPGLQELFDQSGDRLTVVPPDRAQEAVETSRFVFLIVPTPSLDSGAFSNQAILDCLPPIAAALRDGHHPHVVVTCTTSPGSCQTIVDELQRLSGRCAGLDFAFSYSPHFIALGSVLLNMRRPDFILVGSKVPAGADELDEFYADLHLRLGNPLPTIAKMNLVNAELTKLGLNCAVTQKISFANQMAMLCERIPGADAAAVCFAIGLDSRIGRKYLKPGGIFAGPCLLPHALVQTDSGLRRIDQILVGDKVLSHDGNFHAVTETHVREYDGEIVSVVSAGFPAVPLTATPEHPVWASRRVTVNNETHRTVQTTGQVKVSEMVSRRETEFIPIGQLNIGDMLSLPQITVDEIPSPVVRLKRHWKSPVLPYNVADPDLMRIFGLYLAEGSTWRKDIKFSLHENETDLAEDVADVIGRTFGIKVSANRREGTKAMNSELTCTSLATYLRNAFGTHCWNKTVPPQWIGLAEPMLRELLRGIWYGDGSDSVDRYTLGITSYELFNFVRLAFLRLGIAFTTKHYRPRTGRDGTKHRAAYFLTVANPPYTQMMNELLPRLHVTNDRKGKKTVWFDKQEMLCPIRKIERTHYAGPVWNLEVEGSQSYMLESAVVHNCFPRDCRALQTAADAACAEVPLAQATDDINHQMVSHMAHLIDRRNPQRLAILGLSYKPDTAVCEESLATHLIPLYSGHLQEPIRLHDPQAIMGHGNCRQYQEAREALRDADVVVLATDWPEYHHLKPEWFRTSALILDLWDVLDPVAFRHHDRYVPGRGEPLLT